jgi:AI-2 transport protein TqsA
MKLQKIGLIFFIIFCVITLLIIAKGIILPLILAIFLWFIIKEIRDFMDKAEWIKTKIPRAIKTVIASIVILFIIGFISNLIISNVQDLYNEAPEYQENLEKVATQIETKFGLNIGENINNFIVDIDLTSIGKNLLDSFSELFSSAFMILLYLIFILMEETSFLNKLKAIYEKPNEFEDVNKLLIEIDKSLSKYISIKTLLSLITAVSSFAVIKLIGIDFAFFWAACIFILNFIPSIGSLIATLFPAIMALVQYGGTDFTPFILVVLFVGIIQLLVGNFLEPKMMGNSLNISSLVVILSLSVWGAIWGIIGMILSVPITVMMILIFSKIKGTKDVAILLSEKGIIKSNLD